LKLLPENISVGVGLQSGLHLDSFVRTVAVIEISD
jgi:hypothetical protein